MLERLVKFTVLGQEYPLYTDAPEEEVREILQLVRSQIEEQSRGASGVLPANKVAVLTSLNMAGKYVRLKNDIQQYQSSVRQRLENLSQRIEPVVNGAAGSRGRPGNR